MSSLDSSEYCLDHSLHLYQKQMQKAVYNTQVFTVIRSPFVLKKTREQFIKQLLSYSVRIKLHSPIQKQVFIQCLSLLRLPVELEIHC
jgi:ribosomal protein S10